MRPQASGVVESSEQKAGPCVCVVCWGWCPLLLLHTHTHTPQNKKQNKKELLSNNKNKTRKEGKQTKLVCVSVLHTSPNYRNWLGLCCFVLFFFFFCFSNKQVWDCLKKRKTKLLCVCVLARPWCCVVLSASRPQGFSSGFYCCYSFFFFSFLHFFVVELFDSAHRTHNQEDGNSITLFNKRPSISHRFPIGNLIKPIINQKHQFISKN